MALSRLRCCSLSRQYASVHRAKFSDSRWFRRTMSARAAQPTDVTPRSCVQTTSKLRERSIWRMVGLSSNVPMPSLSSGVSAFLRRSVHDSRPCQSLPGSLAGKLPATLRKVTLPVFCSRYSASCRVSPDAPDPGDVSTKRRSGINYGGQVPTVGRFFRPSGIELGNQYCRRIQ